MHLGLTDSEMASVRREIQRLANLPRLPNLSPVPVVDGGRPVQADPDPDVLGVADPQDRLVEEGAVVAAVQSDVADAIADRPDATVMDQEEFQGAMSSVIDQMVGLVTVMLMLAVVIALLGIVNTLALAVFERTRELGLLRAVGMTRSQVRAMVRWESVVISSIGALLGAGLGTGLGLALVKAVEDQGIERIAVPGAQLMIYVAAAALAGVVAAIAPARRASNVDVLRAVVSD